MGEQLMTIRLNGSDLTVTQVIAAARHGEPVALAAEAITAMRHSRTVVEEALSKSEPRSEEHTSELQSLRHLVCRLLLEKKKKKLDSIAPTLLAVKHTICTKSTALA